MKQESSPKKQLKLNSEVITQLNSTGGGGSHNGGGGGGSFILCTVLCNSAVCSILCGCGC
jgi:hypothetical protein